MGYKKSNRKQQKLEVHWLIQHKNWVGTVGQKDFKTFNHLVQCSHKPGDIINDSRGKTYQVMADYSIKEVF